MDDINKRIQEVLHTIEQEKQVRILYACESGSRAWEFASQDSDYDVRFLYVCPKEMYLKLDVPRDVIELPIVDDLDVNGWDIFKALRLLRKSNPPLIEWLFSPFVYAERSPTIQKLREVAQQCYAAPPVFYHYRHMAYGNYHQYIENKTEISIKKYLYVLRPIVALLYIEEQQNLPPTSFLQSWQRSACHQWYVSTLKICWHENRQAAKWGLEMLTLCSMPLLMSTWHAGILLPSDVLITMPSLNNSI